MSEPGVPDVGEKNEKMALAAADTSSCERRSGSNDVSLTVEVNGRRLDIVGLLQLGTSFAADGNLIMSDETFLRVNAGRQRGIINLGLITLKPGANPERVKAEIAAILPPDVRVLTSKEFSDQRSSARRMRRTPCLLRDRSAGGHSLRAGYAKLLRTKQS
jgi:hypothetical protein